MLNTQDLLIWTECFSTCRAFGNNYNKMRKDTHISVVFRCMLSWNKKAQFIFISLEELQNFIWRFCGQSSIIGTFSTWTSLIRGRMLKLSVQILKKINSLYVQGCVDWTCKLFIAVIIISYCMQHDLSTYTLIRHRQCLLVLFAV